MSCQLFIQVAHYMFLVIITSPTRAAVKYCAGASVCLPVSPSGSISLEHTCDLYQFFVHVAYDCG